MTNVVKLHFKLTVECQEELADDLGEDLAKWLLESWFNGEDVLDVEYVDHDVVF